MRSAVLDAHTLAPVDLTDVNDAVTVAAFDPLGRVRRKGWATIAFGRRTSIHTFSSESAENPVSDAATWN